MIQQKPERWTPTVGTHTKMPDICSVAIGFPQYVRGGERERERERDRDSENKKITDEAEKCSHYRAGIAVPSLKLSLGNCNCYVVAIAFSSESQRERKQTEDRAQRTSRKCSRYSAAIAVPPSKGGR